MMNYFDSFMIFIYEIILIYKSHELKSISLFDFDFFKGTTITGILSAFTSPPSTLQKSMQLALVYTFFNTLGVIFWLPIPILRLPKLYAEKLGEIVFKYRWFIYVYVSSVYFIIPLIMLGLALIPKWIGLAIVGIPIILLFLVLLVVLLLRRFCPKILPEKLKNFDWLPIWMRSLEPYDAKMKNLSCCRKKKRVVVVVDRRISNKGMLEEVVVEKEIDDDEPDFIPKLIRNMVSVDNLYKEARLQQRRNTITSGIGLNTLQENHGIDDDLRSNKSTSSNPKQGETQKFQKEVRPQQRRNTVVYSGYTLSPLHEDHTHDTNDDERSNRSKINSRKQGESQAKLQTIESKDETETTTKF
jgi:hypothetical protein